MPIDVQATFRRHGRETLDFLTYCVMSVQLAPLLVFLVGEYRMRPTAAAALALYDMLCAPDAPARVRAAALVLPPRNPRFGEEIETLRHAVGRAPAEPAADGSATPAEPARPSILPPLHLFDFLAEYLWKSPEDPVRATGLLFDPALAPVENLPGGRMSAGQAAFVDGIWRPRVRPVLVAAGFWRIGTIA
jgi:hypothetical protein